MRNVSIPLILYIICAATMLSDLKVSVEVNWTNLAILPYWDRAIDFQQGVPVCDPAQELKIEKKYLSKIDTKIFSKSSKASVLQARVFWLNGMCEEALRILWQVVDVDNHPAAVLLLNDSKQKDFSSDMSFGLSEFAYFNALRTQKLNEPATETIEWLEVSYKLSPQFKAAERLVGYYVAEHRYQDDVLRIWQILEKALPERDPNRWWAAGQIAEAEGRWGEAARFYEFGTELAERPQRFLLRREYALSRSDRE